MVSVNIEFNEESLAAFIDVKMNNKLRFVLYKISELGVNPSSQTTLTPFFSLL